MDTVSIMGWSAVYECRDRARCWQKRCDHVIQETPPEFAGADMAMLGLNPAVRQGSIERRFDIGQRDPRACGKIHKWKTGVQAQRIEHELERQLFRRDDVVAADNS